METIEGTKIRWYGNPNEAEQPDAGDVLGYVDYTGHKPDWWHLVLHAWPVRGRGPEDLWLRVVRLDITPEGGIPGEVVSVVCDQTGKYFAAERRSRRRRR